MEDVNVNELYNKRVSVAVFDGDKNLLSAYNEASRDYTQHASVQSERGKLLLTASMREGAAGKSNYHLYSTVSNVQNMLGAHEYLGHGINRWTARKDTHHKVFDYQMVHPSWQNTTPAYKVLMKKLYNQEKKREGK